MFLSPFLCRDHLFSPLFCFVDQTNEWSFTIALIGSEMPLCVLLTAKPMRNEPRGGETRTAQSASGEQMRYTSSTPLS